MDELYQSQILALARAVRTSSMIAHPTHHATLRNTSCGDEIHLDLHIKNNQICDIHIAVSGCALCEAGAGLLYQQALSSEVADISRLSDDFTAFLGARADNGGDAAVRPFTPFTPLREVRNRHKCATLAFNAFHKAIAQK